MLLYALFTSDAYNIVVLYTLWVALGFGFCVYVYVGWFGLVCLLIDCRFDVVWILILIVVLLFDYFASCLVGLVLCWFDCLVGWLVVVWWFVDCFLFGFEL